MKKFKYLTWIFVFFVICLVNIDCIGATSSDRCNTLSNEIDCLSSGNCVWNNEYGYCNINKLTYVQCGSAYDIPSEVPYFISLGITILKTVTPIVLIIISMITLAKAAAANSEDAMNKAKKGLIGKLIAAALVFFVISIVQFVILKVADDSQRGDVQACLTCFLNDSCGSSTYYKDGYGNCFDADTSHQISCPTSEEVGSGTNNNIDANMGCGSYDNETMCRSLPWCRWHNDSCLHIFPHGHNSTSTNTNTNTNTDTSTNNNTNMSCDSYDNETMCRSDSRCKWDNNSCVNGRNPFEGADPSLGIPNIDASDNFKEN